MKTENTKTETKSGSAEDDSPHSRSAQVDRATIAVLQCSAIVSGLIGIVIVVVEVMWGLPKEVIHFGGYCVASGAGFGLASWVLSVAWRDDRGHTDGEPGV